VRLVVVVDQRGHVGVDTQHDVAAVSAVAAVRAAERLELLPVHGGDPVAAVAGGDVQRHAVDERGDRHAACLSGSWLGKGIRGGCSDERPPLMR